MTDTPISDPSRRTARAPRAGRAERDGGAQASAGGRLDQAALSYEKAVRPFIFVLFFAAVAMPVIFNVGSVRLTPMRTVLLLMFIPLVFRWLSGKHGGIILPDVLLFVFTIWVFIVITFHHGLERSLEFSAINMIEMFGAYLLTRTYVRSKSSFLFFVKCYLVTVLFFLPFAFFESQTREQVINTIFSSLTGMEVYFDVNYPPRMGLFRAQVTFQHPILFGIFCSGAFALAWYGLLGQWASKARRGMWAFVVFMGTFFSLSSGALLTVMTQLGLFGWNFVARNVDRRWRVLGIIVTVLYLSIDILSNRSPAQIFIKVATFNSSTGFNRLLIWQYGSAEVWRHPLMGLGFKDWIRAPWMLPSVDNFWLVMAMRYGLTGFLLIAGAFIVILWRVGRQDFSARPDLAGCQKGYLISIIGLFVGICTVHIWGNAITVVIALIGAGVWMFTTEQEGVPVQGGAAAPAKGTEARTPRDRKRRAPEAEEAASGEETPAPKPQFIRPDRTRPNKRHARPTRTPRDTGRKGRE